MKRILFLFSIFFTFPFYGQNDTLAIIRHTENDMVTPKDLKVVYRGIINEFFIDVPNSKSFKVSGDFMTKKDKNIYKLNPGAGSEVIIFIDIVLKNSSKKSEKHVFKVRRTSGFLSTINGRSGIVQMKKEQLKNAVISVRFEDKNLTFLNRVTRFDLKVPGLQSIQIEGSKIDESTYQKILRKISVGDQLALFDIKMNVYDPRLKGAMCFLTSPLIIQIY